MDGRLRARSGTYNTVGAAAETRSSSPWHVATVLRPLLWLGSLLLACLLVGAPLPCAVHSFRENGSLTWGSQCQYWSWRMMSRSTRVLPVGLLMRSREGGRDSEWSQNVGLRGVWQEAGAYEDRLLSLVHSYKGLRTARGPSSNGTGTGTRTGTRTRTSLDYSSEQSEKYADVWVEVNGPPFQRYVHPKVDLAKQRIEPPSGGIVVAVARYVDELWRGPQPLASWVMPRLLSLRSAEWQRLFEAYEERVARGREGEGPGQCTAAEGEGEREGEGDGAEVVFLADMGGTRPVQISSLFGQEAGPSCDGLRTAEVQVLGGRAQVLNLESPAEVAAGACMRLRGELVLRAVGEEPVVLAVVLTRGHQHCPRLYKKLRLSSAPEGAPMPAPAMLLLALGPNATGAYPSTFHHWTCAPCTSHGVSKGSCGDTGSLHCAPCTSHGEYFTMIIVCLSGSDTNIIRTRSHFPTHTHHGPCHIAPLLLLHAEGADEAGLRHSRLEALARPAQQHLHFAPKALLLRVVTVPRLGTMYALADHGRPVRAVCEPLVEGVILTDPMPAVLLVFLQITVDAPVQLVHFVSVQLLADKGRGALASHPCRAVHKDLLTLQLPLVLLHPLRKVCALAHTWVQHLAAAWHAQIVRVYRPSCVVWGRGHLPISDSLKLRTSITTVLGCSKALCHSFGFR